MADLATIAAAIKGAVDAAKEVGSLTKGARDHEVNDRVLHLQQRLIEVQALVMELSAENEALQKRVSELESAGAARERFQFRDNMYWTVGEGPFCPRCMDAEQKPIHLTPRGMGTYSCPQCQEWFAGAGAGPRGSIRAPSG